MSIFGEERKIKFTKNGTTVLIDHCVILRSEPEPKTIMHESIINRHREWIDIYDHHIVECIAYLCKYADPVAAYQNFLQYEGELVDSLFEYIDGEPLHDENNTAVQFWLDKIKPMYINTDEYPDELRFTFKSQKTVVQSVYKIPSDIPDLWLWFNDDTLTNPSGNLFQWVDKVSGDIILSGNYGAGSGLTPVNGKNVLDVGNGLNSDNQLNQQFFLTEETTFVGVIQNAYPASDEQFRIHRWTQLSFPGGSATEFDFRQYGYSPGGTTPAGLRHNATNGFSPSHDLGFADTPPIDPSTVPYASTFFALRMDSVASSVLLRLNSIDYSQSALVHITKPIESININAQYYGKIFEFLIYRRNLTDDEVNTLKIYFSKKYNLPNI